MSTYDTTDPTTAGRRWVRDYPEVAWHLNQWGWCDEALDLIARDYPYALANRPTGDAAWTAAFSEAATREALGVETYEFSEADGLSRAEREHGGLDL